MSTPTPGTPGPSIEIGPAEIVVTSVDALVATDHPGLADGSFIGIGQLASTKIKRGFLPMSATTIRKMLKAGKFPAPFGREFITRKKLWRMADIEAWIDSLPRK